MKKLLWAVILAVSLLQLNAQSANLELKKGLGGWSTPPYWNGRLTKEKNLLIMESTEQRGRVFARTSASQIQMEFSPGYKLRLTIQAKGSGKLLGGYLVYPFNPKRPPEYVPAKPVGLSAEFKPLCFEVVIPKMNSMVHPYIEIQGKGKAVIRSIVSEYIPSGKGKIIPESPVMAAVENRKPAPVRFRTSFKNTPLKASQVHIQQWGTAEAGGKTDSKGGFVYQPRPAADGDVKITVYGNGAAGSVFLDVMTPAELKKFDDAARRVKLPKLHCLVIGDSLSDFYRGRNWLDKLGYWLNKYNPGKFTFRNAGVGGDQLKRVKQRLLGITGKNKAYRQDMYDNLFQEKYDLVLIFLGQNDTYVMRKDNFEKPQIPRSQQEPLMRWVIRFLQEKTGAPVVLVSPSPCNEAFLLKRVKENSKISGMFGTSREVDHFDSVVRKISREMRLGYIDILNPMRAFPDRAALYVSDGVHLSCRGARLTAYEMLCWFVSGFKSVKKE